MSRLVRSALAALAAATAPAQEPPAREFPPETVERIQRNLRGKLREEYRPDLVRKYLPYLHPTIREPVGDGLVLEVPAGLGNPEAARWGFLDVTAAPFRADPTGREDSTKAPQGAVDFARDRQMVCFFPPGTYRVSDTLTCTQNYYLRANGAIVGAPQFPCVLAGSTRDPSRRAKIFLAPRSPGFGDPARRKFVVHFTNRALPPAEPSMPQANISFNQIFCSIDIGIGEGNPGAVGLRMQAAEGSSVQDVTIDATHGFIGMQGAAGSGGSHHGITILGGRIGIDTHGFSPEFSPESPGTQPTPTLAGIALIGQTEAALVCKSRGPLIGVGWKISTRGKGPVLRIEKDGPWAPFNGSLALIDSEVVFEDPSGENTLLVSERSFYLNNVYLRNAARVFEGGPAARPDGWFRVRELACPRPPGKVRTYTLEEPVYLDGRRLPGMHLDGAAGEPPPPDLQSRHLWGPGFPSWESPGAANVREPPYGARGDGRADDTAAIQKAVDEREIVFLPKGCYRLTRPLVLGPRTKLVGAGQHLSLLMARDPEGPLADPARPAPLVDTPDDPRAETVLAFLGIKVFYQVRPGGAPAGILGHYALRWRCGRKSVFRTVSIDPARLHGFAAPPAGVQACTLKHPLVRIAGSGGGRWYNFFVHGSNPFAPEYRHLLIEDKEDEPLAFYHLHAQHADSEAQVEMRRARNVDVFGVKTEYHTRFLIARDSRDFRIFGHGGNAKAAPGSAHYLFENCRDFLIANVGDQVWLGKTEPPPKDRWVLTSNLNLEEYFPFTDTPAGGPPIRIPSLERPILYRRGSPRTKD